MKLITTLIFLALLAYPQTACFKLPTEGKSSKPRSSAASQDERKTITGKVVGVTDGDTLTVLDQTNTQYRIRLAGIDAPESKQDYGQASKKGLSDLTFGKQVEVLYTKLDRYGRVLGVIMYNRKDINLMQVQAGLAWHYKEYEMEQTPEDRQAYGAAEEQARSERRGLWQQPNPVKPSDFRRSQRERNNE
jgi:endonuclease YncB( thermonuclease family)